MENDTKKSLKKSFLIFGALWLVAALTSCVHAVSNIGVGSAEMNPIVAAGFIGGPVVMFVALLFRTD